MNVYRESTSGIRVGEGLRPDGSRLGELEGAGVGIRVGATELCLMAAHAAGFVSAP